MTLNKPRVFSTIAILVLLFNLAVVTRHYIPIPATIFGFFFLVTIPGILGMLALRFNPRDGWRYTYYTVCLSLIVLMVTGLAVNSVGWYMGNPHPLSTFYLLPGLDGVLLGLFAVASLRTRRLRLRLRVRSKQLWGYILPLAFPALACMGATSLNNGGSNILTVVLLAGIAATFIYMMLSTRRLSEGHVRFAILCMSAALLLMTSMRGWHITGHDIQREFHVFQLTKSAWHWDIATLRDPYNACLSITILPTMFAGLLNIADVYVYKLLFQVLFALSSVGVYLIVRRFAAQCFAILSTFFYVAFPTFFTDMPMLNRQEVAFLMIGAMFLAAFHNDGPVKLRRRMIGLFGIGVVLSHYSTTYSMIVILFVTVVGLWLLRRKPIINFLVMLSRKLSFYKTTKKIKLQLPGSIVKRRPPIITLQLIAGLMIFSFAWSTQLTRTSNGLGDVALKTLSGFRGNLEADKSVDTKASLFSWNHEDQAIVFDALITKAVHTERAGHEQDYYSPEIYEKYPIKFHGDTQLQPSAFGGWLEAHGLDLTTLNFIIRQGWAKLFQLLIGIGMLVLYLRRKYSRLTTTDYIGLSFASLVFVVLLVMLPEISVDYGLLRGLQQALMVLALPAAIGVYSLFAFLKGRSRWITTVLFASTFYFSTSGLLPELTGGFSPQLHLHNQGAYYETYLHQSDISSIVWLSQLQQPEKRTILQADVESDRFATIETQNQIGSLAATNILPGLVQKDAYVYLNYATINHGLASFTRDNDTYSYVFPRDFLDDNKDLIYSNDGARIYR